MSALHHGHDRAAKLLFRHPRVVEDLLRGFVPGAGVGEFNFTTLRPLPAEFIDGDLHERHGDRLWLVRRRDGSQVVVMLEFQSTVDHRMAARMATYAGMLYEQLTPVAREPDGRLPALLPVVLYTGAEPWTAARDLAEVVGSPGEVARYMVGVRYELLDVREMGTEDLPDRNRMAVMVALETSESVEALGRVLSEALEWLGEDERELGLAYVEWVGRVLVPLRFPWSDAGRILSLKEGVTMLAERAKGWTEEWFRQGMAQGMEQGMEQGLERGRAEERALLCRQASRRFGAGTAERLAEFLDEVDDPERLAEVGDWIVDCATGAALLDRLADLSSRT